MFYTPLNNFSEVLVGNNAAEHQQSTYDSIAVEQQPSLIDMVHLNRTREVVENHSDNSEVDITSVDPLETNLASTISNSMY